MDKVDIRFGRRMNYHPDHIFMYVCSRKDDKTVDCLSYNAKGMFIENVVPYASLGPESSLQIDLNTLQSVVDQLYDLGIRQTEAKGSAGSLSATTKHLNDMRRIVSKKLGVDLG